MLEKIDHIVYAVQDLDQAVRGFSKQTGLQVIPGGQHLEHGTHNAIVRIGATTYLEFIAKDESLEVQHTSTWMGLDLLTQNKITRWALQSTQVEQDAKYLKLYQPGLDKIKIGSRAKADGTMLNWLMTTVEPTPEVEPAPFLLDWKNSVHPTQDLPLECSIQSFGLEYAGKESLQALLKNLRCDIPIRLATESSIKLSLQTPKGVFSI